jgi:large subunit ribosomal protein L23
MTKSAYDIILKPIITEKSMAKGAEENTYVFKVDKKAAKIQIKQAIESAFKVTVDKVRTANFKGKEKRQGKYSGFTASYKKAYVTLTPDSKKIEFFEGMN